MLTERSNLSRIFLSLTEGFGIFIVVKVMKKKTWRYNVQYGELSATTANANMKQDLSSVAASINGRALFYNGLKEDWQSLFFSDSHFPWVCVYDGRMYDVGSGRRRLRIHLNVNSLGHQAVSIRAAYVRSLRCAFVSDPTTCIQDAFRIFKWWNPIWMRSALGSSRPSIRKVQYIIIM